MHPLRYSKFKSMETKFRKKKKKRITKNETKHRKTTKESDPSPVIDCRPNNAKFILHAFKKKKLLLQTFFSIGKRGERRWKANVWNCRTTAASNIGNSWPPRVSILVFLRAQFVTKRRMKKDEEINKKNFKQWEDFFRLFLILRASFSWNGTKRQRNSIRVSFFTGYINTKDNVSPSFFLLRISVNRGIKFLCLIKLVYISVRSNGTKLLGKNLLP